MKDLILNAYFFKDKTDKSSFSVYPVGNYDDYNTSVILWLKEYPQGKVEFVVKPS